MLQVKLYIPTKSLKCTLSQFNFYPHKHSEFILNPPWIDSLSGTVISYFSIPIIKESDEGNLQKSLTGLMVPGSWSL